MDRTVVWNCKWNTPVGVVTCTSDGINITGLWFEGQKYYPDTVGKTGSNKIPVFEGVKRWLDIYFAGEEPDFMLPLAPYGTSFRQMVWGILCTIPYGQTTTYGDIAKEMAQRLGKEKMSAQAVGGAVGHNPISILIPCHRVIGMDGSLTGYAGGLERKRRLLEIEHVDYVERR